MTKAMSDERMYSDMMKNGSFGSMNINTTLPSDMLFNDGHRVQIVGYSVLMSISSIENLTVLVLLCLKRPVSRMNMLLISLTISDLLVTFLTMPLEIAWAYTVQWLADDSVCKFMMVGRIFGLYSSSFNLVAISIDRFCIIMYPFTNMTSANKRVRWLLATVWTLSAICSLPQALVFRKQYHPVFPTYAQCATFGSFASEELEMSYNVFVTLMLFVIPLILFSIFYGQLWCFIRRRHLMTSRTDDAITSSAAAATIENHNLLHVPMAASRRSKWRAQVSHEKEKECVDYNMIGQSMRYTNAPNIYMRAKSKSFKMAITLVIVFLVCWVPYYLVSCWFWLDKESLKYIDPRIQRTLFIFAVSQSCLNPIVTGVFSLRLDKKLARLYCCRKTLPRFRHQAPENDTPRNGNNINLASPAATCFVNRSVRRQNQDQFI